jgi:hypothetical protein
MEHVLGRYVISDKPMTEEQLDQRTRDGDRPLDFLRAVHLNEGLPLTVRMRAAIEAAPYVHPKLSATAVMTSDDFGDRLERAILRSIGARRALPEPE